MKRFIGKLLAGALALLVFVAGFNALYVRTEYYHDLNDTAKYHELPAHIAAANLGNSHSRAAFDWSLYPEIEGADLTLGAQTHDYDHAILCQYFDHFSESSVLFLDVSCFSLYADTLTEDKYPSAESRYYSFLKRQYFPRYRLRYAVFFGLLPVLSAQPHQLAEAFFTYEKEDEAQSRNRTIASAGADENRLTEEGRNRIAYLFSYCLPPTERSQYDSVRDILDMSRDKNMRVVLITTPTTPYFYEAIPQDYSEAFHRDISALLNDYPNAVYLDYTGDARFSDLALYQDLDHLNAAGSALFMRTLFDDIQAYGIFVA